MSHVLYLTLIEDPINNGIIRSQVLSVLKHIANEGRRVTLLSAPSRRLFSVHARDEIRRFKEGLNSCGIRFLCYPMPLLSNGFVRLAYLPWLIAFAFPLALIISVFLRVNVIHCRSYPAGLIGMLVKWVTGKTYIFDMRGVYPEEAAFLFRNWNRDGLNFRAWKWLERKMLESADRVIVVSERFRTHLSEEYPGLHEKLVQKVNVIFCGIESTDVQAVRPTDGTLGRPIRLVYSGSIDGWTSPELLAKTYKGIVAVNASSQFFLSVYTTSDQQKIRAAMSAENIPPDTYQIERLKVSEVMPRLSQNDFGILVRESSVVNEVSFPVKLGEYLAAGLPVIVNPALAGAGVFIKKHNVGIVLDSTWSLDGLISGEVKPEDIADAVNELVNTPKAYSAVYAELVSR